VTRSLGSDYTRYPSRNGVWKQLNDQLNSIGLWLDTGIRRVIRKPPTNGVIRVLFLVSALLVSGWLLLSYSLQISGQEVIVVDVVSTLGTHLVFLVIAVALSVYLAFMPTNWMRALQVLMWVCLARGALVLAWNLLVIARDWPYLMVQTNFLLVLVNYVFLVPFIGFMNVAPATYVWIRTRREVIQA